MLVVRYLMKIMCSLVLFSKLFMIDSDKDDSRFYIKCFYIFDAGTCKFSILHLKCIVYPLRKKFKCKHILEYFHDYSESKNLFYSIYTYSLQIRPVGLNKFYAVNAVLPLNSFSAIVDFSRHLRKGP